MPKSKEQKKEILESLKDKLKKSKSVIFSSDSGLNVKTIEALRKDLKDNQAEYLVTKKTLLKLAAKDTVPEESLSELKGSVALTLSYDDEVAGARILNKYTKDNETLEMSGGVLEGSFILPEVVSRLANLPAKEELLAKLVGSINSPLSGLVGVLSGVQRNFVGVLKSIAEAKK